MAHTSAIRSAAESAAYALDKPMLVGRNWCRGATMQWKQGGSWASGADESATGYAGALAGDDFDHVRTYPASSQATWYFLIDIGTATGVVDCLALLNPYGLTGAQIELQVADNNAYSTNLITVATITPTTGARVIQLDLHDTGSVPLRYSATRYWRLKCTKGGGCQPRFGEVVLGNSLQLAHGPNRPYSGPGRSSLTERFEAYSGVGVEYVMHRGRRQLRSEITLTSAADVTALESWFDDDIANGTQPFLWIDAPATYPGRALWMRLPESPRFSPSRDSFGEWTLDLAADECGPNFLAGGI